MKRRNVECSKLRRTVKRNKITEGIYGSTLLYIKFLLVWGVALIADFILQFRFEFLWPFWLLLRSSYDSYRYQGLAFCIFFVCIAVTSDMIFFFFLPVQWLFFAASTYVWVQYIWHSDRGFNLPTVIMWLLFLYVEAAVRFRDVKHLPFHVDLCRPFAAHCIGFPVVTLGFGFRSYIGYRLQQKSQKEVAKENEFLMHLLQQAIPHDNEEVYQNLVPPHNYLDNHKHHHNCPHLLEKNKGSTSQNDPAVSNGIVQNGTSHPQTSSAKNNHRKSLDKGERDKSTEQDSKVATEKSPKYSTCNGSVQTDMDYIERVGVKTLDRSPGANRKTGSSNFVFKSCEELQHRSKSCRRSPETGQGRGSSADEREPKSPKCAVLRSVNDFDVNEAEKDKSAKISVQSLKSNSSSKWSSNQSRENNQRERKNKVNRDVNRENAEANVSCKDEYYSRLEADVRRFKVDLQQSRQVEQELRGQINTLVSGEQSVKNELTQVQQDNDTLQSKLHGLVTARQSDKQTISQLERRLQDERRLRGTIEAQLTAERKAKKAEEAVAARAVAMAAAANKNECTESCRARRKDLEAEGKQLRRELKLKDERYLVAEREMQALRQYKETHNETEILMSALSAMQDKNSHLENSLSAETRIKLDLFSALGEAKRQLEIREGVIRAQEKEIDQLKTKIAQVLAVMPNDSFGPQPTTRQGKSKLCIIETQNTCITCNISTLDPNATAYTPKNSLVASTKG